MSGFDPATRTLTLAGRRWTAAPVSAEQVRRWVEAHDAAAGEATREVAALTAFLRCAFPLRWSYVWTGDPVRLLLKAPADEVEGMMASFFRWAGVRLHRR